MTMKRGRKTKKAASEVQVDKSKDTGTKRAGSKRPRVMPSKSSESEVKRIKLTDVVDVDSIVCGTVLAVGTGDMGQLGLGEDLLLRKKPAIVKKLQDRNIRLAVAGGIHTCCLTDDNQLFTFGCNDEAALGRPTTEDGSEYEPELVGGCLKEEKICQMVAGDSHTAVLTSDGKVFIWGSFRDGHGTMGLLQPKESCVEPKQVSTLNETIIQLASGSDHLLMLSAKGNVYSMGRAEQGQLGRISRYFSDRTGSRNARKERGEEYDRTTGSMLIPQRVQLAKGRVAPQVVKIFCGSYSSYALTSEDKMFAWGLNNYNQLGIKDGEVKYHPVHVAALSGRGIQQLAAGEHHACFLTDEGKVYSVGRGCYGRLGLGESVKQADEPSQILQLFDVASISSKDSITYAVSKDGKAWGWGFGTNMQLTDGETDDHWTPTPLQGRNLEGRDVLRVSCGSQHCLLVVGPKHE